MQYDEMTRHPFRRMQEQDRETVLEMMRVFYSSDAVLSNGSEDIFNNDITACVSDNPYLEGYVFTYASPPGPSTNDAEPGEDGIAGYAMLAHSFSTEYGRPCVWIEDIYLSDEARGLGLASAFFDFLSEAYPEALHRLEVENENTHAVQVYMGKGFKVMPYVEMYR